MNVINNYQMFWFLFDAATFNKELILNIGGGGAVYLGLDISLNTIIESRILYVSH